MKKHITCFFIAVLTIMFFRPVSQGYAGKKTLNISSVSLKNSYPVLLALNEKKSHFQSDIPLYVAKQENRKTNFTNRSGVITKKYGNKNLKKHNIEKNVNTYPQWIKTLLIITEFLLVSLLSALIISRAIIKKQGKKLKTKNAELKKNRDRYKQLLDESPISIILFDETGTVTFVNDWHIKVFAKNKLHYDFFLGKKITELPGIVSAGLQNEIKKIFKGKTVILKDIFVPLFSGGYGGYLNIKGVPVYEDGQFKGGILIGENVTEHKKAKKEAEEQYLFFKAIIDAMPCAIDVKDHKARVIFVNKMAKDILCMTDKDILNKTSIEFIKNKQIADTIYKEDMDLLLRKKEKIEHEGQYKDSKGRTRHIYIEKFPLTKDSDSNIKQILTVVTDTTKIIELEGQVLQAQKMESIGVLAGGVAHDFNNILTIINGRCDMALMSMDDNSPLYKDINEIHKAGKQAEILTRQLLAFSRKQIYHPELVDINKLIANSDKMLRRLIGENIEMELFFDKRELFIKADPGQIEQIFMNLVVNARDSIAEKTDNASKMKITIETGLSLLDDEYIINHPGATKGLHVYFSVSDTGAGMDKKTRDNIFSPFFTTKPSGKGTGLGLSTVYGIVKQNKGFVYVYSEPGKGATFKIYWPYSETKQHNNGIKSYQDEMLFKGNETILLAEDNESLRIFTKESLKKMGYAVYEASNGKKAMELTEFVIIKNKIKIDLLITDIIMPEMGGRELAEKLNTVFPDMKVLFTSGYTDNHIVKNGELKRGLNFIQKPFTIHQLSGKIREVLEQQ